MKRGFTLIEVLIATVILGFALTGLLVSFSHGQKLLRTTPDLVTAQEMMDLGDMAYPLEEVKEEEDIDVSEKGIDDLWRIVSGDHGPRLSNEQREKYHGFTWKRERVEPNRSDDDLKRLGYLHRVRVTVTWGDRFVGERDSDGYVTLWKDPTK